MARSFLVPLDMNKLEVLNVRLQNLASAPSAPGVGQIYFDTALSASYVWNGTAWVSNDVAKAAAGSIPNSALATNPLARANHTGVQLAATISDLATTVKAYRLSEFGAPTANVPMAGFTLTGLNTAPNAAGQAAEYSWVIGQIQSAAAGISSRAPVRAVATSNSALSGLLVIDGVTLIAGDRVLAVGQTTASQNGVYIAASGAWARAADSDQAAELIAGALWLVQEGTAFAGTQWRMATTGAITVGTTALSIVQFSAGGVYTAGNGISLVGSAITFLPNPAAGSGLVVTGSGAAVDTNVVARKFSATIGDGAATAIVVTHNLGTQDVHLYVRQAASPFAAVECDMASTTTNTATFTFATAPTASQYRVTVIG